MEANLYRIRAGWAIKAGNETVTYDTIEQAADVLVSIGVVDDEIDVALVEMMGHGHTRANFGVNGTFVFSDEGKLDELLGVA